MPRATWSGFLRLALVSCPIYLSPATTRTKSIRLHRVWQPAAATEREAGGSDRDRDRRSADGSTPQRAQLDAAHAGAHQRPDPEPTARTDQGGTATRIALVMSMLDIEDPASIQIMGKIDGGPSDWRVLKSRGNVDIAEVGDDIVLLTCIGHDPTTPHRGNEAAFEPVPCAW